MQEKQRTQKKRVKYEELICKPDVSLTLRNKKRIESILKRKNITAKEERDDDNDSLIITITGLNNEELIKYEMYDKTDYTITLNGTVVADMGWDTFVKIGPKGKRIFDTIDLIRDKSKELSQQR